jgi:peptide/nickel transport system substrate-binding protein
MKLIVRNISLFLTSVLTAVLFFSTQANSGTCTAITAENPQGIDVGLSKMMSASEFEAAGSCTMSYSENPKINEYNAMIFGNPDLPSVADRLPDDPVVMIPNRAVGIHGGQMNHLGNNTEAGTGEFTSVRNTNLVVFDDDLQKIHPLVAESYEWNDDFTVLTFKTRPGLKWSNGDAFTADDITFWYNDFILDENIYPKRPTKWMVAGKPMVAETIDDTTMTFTLPSPKPGLIGLIAGDYGATYLPKTFLKQFHPKYNPDADKVAKAAGLENGYAAIDLYYGGSDWTDVPSPMFKNADAATKLGLHTKPMLEPWILISEDADHRRWVPNPYYFGVDSAGQQLPYIDQMYERYVPQAEVRNLMISNGEIGWKAQSLNLEDAPVLQKNQEEGGYKVHFVPRVGGNVNYAFNYSHKDEGMAAIFNDIRFRQAASLAMDREEILDLVHLGEGEIMQATRFDPAVVDWISQELKDYYTDFDPDTSNALLDEMGMKDIDGDGYRERPDGSQFLIQNIFCEQYGPRRINELWQGYFKDIGINMSVKEVTTDEYRALQGSNDHDMGFINTQFSALDLASRTQNYIPPFNSYFGLTFGQPWAVWMDGAGGIEPPQHVKDWAQWADEFQQYEMGSDEQNAVGIRLAESITKQLYWIGHVGSLPQMLIIHNDIENANPNKAFSWDHLLQAPNRFNQFFFKEGSRFR